MATRKLFPKVRNLKSHDQVFQTARAFVYRTFTAWSKNNNCYNTKAGEIRLRRGGAGSREKLPELGRALYDWLIVHRNCFKSRVTISTMLQQGRFLCEIAERLLQGYDVKAPAVNKLWVDRWKQRFHVSLKHVNKRYKVADAVRKRRIGQGIRNCLRFRI